MKRIFLFFFFAIVACLSTQKSLAQGNLQFNRVISTSLVLNAGQSSSLITVPAGKVWKIESITANVSGNSNHTYEINGNALAIFPISSPPEINYGKWLKAGDTFKVSNSPYGANPTTYYYSIIEFNIVP